MAFNSFAFLLFFLSVFSLHWLLPNRLRNLFLLAASYGFYASRDWRWALLLLFVTATSYLSGRLGTALAVCIHLGILGFFKCTFLPIGLSFYTFTSLGYVLDAERGRPRSKTFADHALFVSFFPQIVAGPIARVKSLLPQIQDRRSFDWRRFQEGCHLIFWGLFQKTFIADNLARSVDPIFDGPIPQSGVMALLGLYGFALQLYSDFSGYSDMARGLGKCLGFELARNFNLPFFALDMQDFWRRWHVSLSDWFMDFLYRPLLKAPSLLFRLYGAPIVTMIAMGLWHGPKATLVLMGFYYGLVIALTGLVKSKLPSYGRAGASALWPWAQRLLTLHLACGGLMLLRAHSVKQALLLSSRIILDFSFPHEALGTAKWLLFFAWPVIFVEALGYRKGDLAILRIHPILRTYFYILMFCLMLIFGSFENKAYFYSAF